MDRQTALIERIVSEVLARMANEPTGTLPVNDQVCLQTSPVTLESLRGKLDSAKQLVVPRRAVVTPAVRDLLRERGVELVRQDVASAGSEGANSGLIVLDRQSKAVIADRQLLSTAIEGWPLREVGNCVEAVAEATQVVTRANARVVIVTDRAATVACEVNRNKSLRAAVVTQADEVIDIVDDLDVNVAVIRPIRKSNFEVRRLIEQFSAAIATKQN